MLFWSGSKLRLQWKYAPWLANGDETKIVCQYCNIRKISSKIAHFLFNLSHRSNSFSGYCWIQHFRHFVHSKIGWILVLTFSKRIALYMQINFHPGTKEDEILKRWAVESDLRNSLHIRMTLHPIPSMFDNISWHCICTRKKYPSFISISEVCSQ